MRFRSSGMRFPFALIRSFPAKRRSATLKLLGFTRKVRNPIAKHNHVPRSQPEYGKASASIPVAAYRSTSSPAGIGKSPGIDPQRTASHLLDLYFLSKKAGGSSRRLDAGAAVRNVSAATARRARAAAAVAAGAAAHGAGAGGGAGRPASAWRSTGTPSTRDRARDGRWGTCSSGADGSSGTG